MALELGDCIFQGPALPEPFVKFELEKELARLKLLPKTVGEEGQKLKAGWEFYRRKLHELAASGGALRVRHHAIEPLLEMLGYAELEEAGAVQTREDLESGGALLVSKDGASRLRVWTAAFNEDLYAPFKRGRAYRYSRLRIAQRVLLAAGERLGLLCNGVQLLLLISDPARPDSTVTISLDPGWKRSRDVPDSFRFLLALTSPAGVQALPELVDKARLQQARVTKELRVQARRAVERFIQEIIDHPANRAWFEAQADRQALARSLWREGLVTVYRLLFILKLESSDDPARSFSFASTSLWRNTFSPGVALAGYARELREKGAETGSLLESGLRALFRMFEEGLECTELTVKPLGGALFGKHATPTLSNLAWGEQAAAWLLDQLLWTPRRRGSHTRERVHYGPLDVEDLGRVYEALLELEPGISAAPMCRLRRQKLEVVVPLTQGEKYRPAEMPLPGELPVEDDENDGAGAEEEETPAGGKRTKVEWIEAIPPGRFYLRVGLGRKASGSYYTPHSFVRFLVQETLGPQVAERSPADNPQPVEILKLKVLDPAMGSGHFLVEACRFLGDRLYEACRLCDENALAAERRAESAKTPGEREEALKEAQQWRQRVIDLPDPEDELLKYLPSRSPEGEESGFSQKRAEALCRRLVATHCLYGVDKNPLAVELAKLALWLESHAEGMPLTFLDHRLVVGDSLTGPFWHHLIYRPGNPKQPVENLFHQGMNLKFANALREAIRDVQELEASVGINVADIRHKQEVKAQMDRALLPFRVAAAAWSGGVMLGAEQCDDPAYAEMLQTIANSGDLPERIASARLRNMIARGLGVEEVPEEREIFYELMSAGQTVPALSYNLTFPEVFYPTGVPHGPRGFHAVLGNPPWDTIRKNEDQFFGMFDFTFLDPPTKREKAAIKDRLLTTPEITNTFNRYVKALQERDRINDTLFKTHKVKVRGQLAGRGTYDDYMLFAEKAANLIEERGIIGFVLPSAFHANEGATGIRKLFIENLGLRCCFSFENRRKLFEIDSRFKFALIVASKKRSGDGFYCAFYLHDDEWLFSERDGQEPLKYKLDFIRKTGGDYLSLLELRSHKDLEIAEICFANGKPFGEVCDHLGIKLSQELNMTYDAWRFTPTAEVLSNGEDPRDPDITARLLEMGYLVLHEGKTFWHYTDRWEDRARYVVTLKQLVDKPNWIISASYYRIAFRDVASSTNERTVVFCLLPPSCVVGNTAPTEKEINKRTNVSALNLMAMTNTFMFDWTIRLKATSHVNLFILNGGVIPRYKAIRNFFAHSALRLITNHKAYETLWIEQVGDTWREPGKSPFTWPVLAGEDERWEVRAAIDAVVAQAYGLNREQYAHVLSTFSHASYPKAPQLCLGKFDELQQTGLEPFTQKYDPYWDIPLNENLPKPVIELPVGGKSKDLEAEEFKLSHPPGNREVKRKR